MKTKGDPPVLVRNRKEMVQDMEDKYGYLFCEFCKRSRGFYKLHVHHIVFRSEAPHHKDLHDKKNLIICCDTCHDKFHKNKWIREPLVVARKLRELFKGLIIS
jgi:5-methylcytosine-specific restriction endonuclease McrA